VSDERLDTFYILRTEETKKLMGEYVALVASDTALAAT